MKNLPETQRPYEKCLQYGPQSLSDRELLAVLIRSGTQGKNSLQVADELMTVLSNTAFPGLPGLTCLSMTDLTCISGIGTVKALQLLCIAELSKRIAVGKAKSRLQFQDSSTIASYYMERLRFTNQEVVILMMMNSKLQLLAESEVSRGTVHSSVITPREIFMEALRLHAVGIILIHNHPSGDPTPSQEDHLFTQRVKDAGELVGVALLDHIVIGDRTYFSYHDEKLV